MVQIAAGRYRSEGWKRDVQLMDVGVTAGPRNKAVVRRPLVLSGLHDLSTCFAFSHATAPTSRLGRAPFGCSHSTASAFLCHGESPFRLLEVQFCRKADFTFIENDPVYRWPVSFEGMETDVQLMP
jgi:hypothetical protein